MQQSAKKKEIYKWVEKISAHFCNKIVCISDAEKTSALEEKICDPRKLQLIYNGIDVNKVLNEPARPRKNLGIPEGAFVVGQVGRLSKQKAPDIFVEAAALIKKVIPNAFFVLVGDGELRQKVEHLIDNLGLKDSFLVTGWVDEPAGYMKMMDIATLLSRWEGFGLVLPEYMICRVPIVATNVDAIPDIIINNQNGYLVNKDDPKEIAERVAKIKNSDVSRIINNGLNKALSEYDGGKMAEETITLFRKLSNKK